MLKIDLYKYVKMRLNQLEPIITMEREAYKDIHGEARWIAKQKSAKKIRYKIVKDIEVTDAEFEEIYNLCLYAVKTKSKKQQLKRRSV